MLNNLDDIPPYAVSIIIFISLRRLQITNGGSRVDVHLHRRVLLLFLLVLQDVEDEGAGGWRGVEVGEVGDCVVLAGVGVGPLDDRLGPTQRACTLPLKLITIYMIWKHGLKMITVYNLESLLTINHNIVQSGNRSYTG